MSDYAQAPDWWLASDGKWYPPTSQPGYPTGSVQPPPVLSRTLSVWLQVLFWFSAGLSIIVMGLFVRSMQGFDTWWDSTPAGAAAAFDDWIAAEDAMIAVDGIHTLVLVATWIVLIVWTFKFHKVASWLNPATRKWSSGWAVGGWFIPFANVVIPKQLLNENERLVRSVRDPAAAGTDWRRLKTSGVGWVWWVTWIVAIIPNTISSMTLTGQAEELFYDPGTVRSGYMLGATAFAMWAIAGAAGAMYVRAMARSITGP